MKNWTLEEAFRVFGAEKWHAQMTWSAIAENSISVITLWNHLINTNLEERKLTYSCFEEEHIWWQSHAGNNQRKLHIQNAIDLHEGYFSAIRVYVVDESIKPHSIKKQIPMLDYWWRIKDFNPVTGEFTAECDASIKRGKDELLPKFL